MSRTTRRDFLKWIGLGAASAALPLRAAPRRKPNIVFFLADDMGWMDSTVYGSRYYDTPNMERLATQAMRFTNAYAANPLCSPTRASILTGKYPARLRITTPAGHLPPQPDAPDFPPAAPSDRRVICPTSRRFLPPGEYTIAEALRDTGYRTGFVGKWHLGLRPEHWPERQGFEFSFHGAPDPGPRSYFSPYRFRAGTVTDGPEGEYITDRVTDEAVRYIEKHKDEPFFLCLWHYAVHGPWGHKEAFTRTYEGKVDPRGEQNNPIMASMLKSMDESLGRVMEKLDDLGLADETLLIFFSDNGGNIHSRIGPKQLPPTNNAPLRGGKAHIYEGGTREPMLVRWPGVVKPGSVSAEVVSSIDFYRTLLEAAGAKAKPGQVIDGVSLLPALKGGTLERDAIFCHFPHGLGTLNAPSTYIRKGEWKLIRFYETNENFPNARELYNLKDDIGETANLAAKMPEKVKELDALIDRFLKDTGALVPKPNPAYRPSPPSVGGWRPLNESTLRVEDGVLVIEAKARRVQMHRTDLKGPAGKLTVKFRIRTQTGTRGFGYWATGTRPRFSPERRYDFATAKDGQWHEHTMPFTAEAALAGLRLDFSLSPGRVDVDWVRLCGPDGAVLQAWEFGGQQR